ncbi:MULTISPECIES: hypothetical protein [unclassified Gordonia (in: high G+C Gram-positive bacteria)]|uniref:hypothetical protein n=1 Tax=unclassified Gordonia (in: high G+C Gram-positive bacteria) TaxID=2657482 RepID=UPI0010F4BCAF|nr:MULTISPECIES: hypothetical protein [unclassified Gordonia (in: high G+C Gram-positive bacteria)]
MKFQDSSTAGLADLIAQILPATLSADLAAPAAHVVARAEAMGLIRLDDGHIFDHDTLGMALRELATAGVGRHLMAVEDITDNPRGALEVLNQAIVASPYPKTEWASVTDVLGTDLATRMVGISDSSLRRYSSGDRDTPDDVAARLHFLAMVIADLLGSYNRYGVRRWFVRPRRPLGGKPPAEVLTGGKWEPESAAARMVAELAESLTGLGAV